MLLGDEALGLGTALGGVAGVVAANDLQLTAVHAALGVDLGHGEVDAAQDVLADGGVAAGHGIDGADADGAFLGHRGNGEQRHEHRQDAQHGNQFLHGILLLVFL